MNKQEGQPALYEKSGDISLPFLKGVGILSFHSTITHPLDLEKEGPSEIDFETGGLRDLYPDIDYASALHTILTEHDFTASRLLDTKEIKEASVNPPTGTRRVMTTAGNYVLRGSVVMATVLGVGVAIDALFSATAYADSGDSLSFKLGFENLAKEIPQIAGTPLEDEHYGPNGDSLQQTTTGLMAWRKADNWTAFTDGSRTWVMGPDGLHERGNNERFDWESPEVVIVDKPGDPDSRKKVEEPIKLLQEILPKLRTQDPQIYGPIGDAIDVMTKYGVIVYFEKERFPNEGFTLNIQTGKQFAIRLTDSYINRNYRIETRAIIIAHELRHINDIKMNPEIKLDELELNAHGQSLILANFFQLAPSYIKIYEDELENQRKIFAAFYGK